MTKLKNIKKLMKISNWSLLYKLIFSYAGIFSLVLFIIIQMFYTSIVDDVRRETIDYASLYIEQLNATMNDYLNEFERLSAMTLADETLQEILNEDVYDLDEINKLEYGEYVENFLFSLYTLQPDIQNIMLVDHRGYLYSEGIRRYTMEDSGLHTSLWYQEATENKGKVFYDPLIQADSYTSHMSKEPYLSVIRAVRTIGDTDELGVIRIDIPVSKIESIINSGSSENKIKIIVTDKYHNVISDTDEIFDQLYSNNSEVFEDDYTVEITDESTQFIINNEGHMLLQDISATTGWIVYGFVPNDWLVSESAKTRGLSLLLIAVGVFAVVILSTFISYTITRPIKKLQKGMKKVEKGDYDAKIIVNSSDEIGYLGMSFNQMTSQINDHIRSEYELTIRTRDAELKALLEEISPHFLYNTLDSIRTRANKNDDQEVADMIEILATFLRLNMIKGKGLCKLSEELTHIETYLQIHNMRYQDKFSFILDVDEKLKKISIPKLTLQPIVENAFLHGFKGMNTGCMLIIHTHVEEQILFIDVIDNGSGFDDELVDKMNEALNQPVRNKGFKTDHNHIGINNVNQRLKIHFGEQYGLHIASEIGKGTKVTIKVPINELEE